MEETPRRWLFSCNYGDLFKVTGLAYVLINIVRVFLTAIEALMLIRAILSWLPVDEDSPLGYFVYMMTEPIVMPVRMVLERFDSIKSMPIDISFFVSFLLLSAIQMAL